MGSHYAVGGEEVMEYADELRKLRDLDLRVLPDGCVYDARDRGGAAFRSAW